MAAVKQHIAAGTDLEARDNGSGSTPLVIACVMGRTEAAEALIAAGADLEAKNNEQTTPLYNAAFFCHPETVELLLKHKANVNTTDKNGTPLVDVMAASWEAVAGIYQFVYSAIGLEFDAEEIKTTRPLLLKMLKEHVAKGSAAPSAMVRNGLRPRSQAFARPFRPSQPLTGPCTTMTFAAVFEVFCRGDRDGRENR